VGASRLKVKHYDMSVNYVASYIRSLFGKLDEVVGGTLWRSSLRHCATSQKVAGSILDEVIGIFR